MNKLVLLALLTSSLFAQSVSINGVPNQTFVGPSGTPQYIAPQAIAGCGVEYVSGLTYTVGACNYSINGVTYNSPLSNITLPAADATNPEIDVIYVDTTGVVQVIQGTPAVTPQQPVVDPSTQLQLTFVLVPATATTPANTTTVLIYDEGTEWTAAKGGTSSANVNLTSTNNPYHGTHDTEFGAGGTVATTTYAQYTKPAAGTVTLGNYNTLTLYVRNKAAWPKTRSVTVQWYNGTTPLGTAVVLSNAAYGFDATGNITSYQQISIPASTFGINGTAATTVRFTVSGSGSNLTGFYLDEVSLQGGSGGVLLPTTLMNYRGAWSATATYQPNDTVVSGGIGYVALVQNTNVAVSTASTWSPLATSGGGGTSNPSTCTVSTATNICLNLAPYYASPDGATTTTTSGTFGVGTSGTIASCSTFSVNQGVDIVGAGAAGADYIGTVVSCSGTTLTVTPAISTSVATGTVVKHDETNALQSALTALDAGATHSGTIWLQPLAAAGTTAVYRINGPLQNTGTANAIIQLPSVTNYSTQIDVISIQGFNEPGQTNVGQGPVILTDKNSGNLFGAYDGATGGGYPPLTAVNFSMSNLVIEGPTNPSITLLNLANAYSFQGKHLLIRSVAATLPTSGTGYGVVMPLILNNVENQLDDVIVAGFGTGAQLAEHEHIGWMEVANNTTGLLIDTGHNATAPGGFKGTAVAIDYIWCGFNTTCIASGSNDTAVALQSVDSELSTTDISDSGNHLRGYIQMENPYSPNTLTVTGGSNLTIFNTWLNKYVTGLTAANITDSALSTGLVGNTSGLLGTITALPNGTTATTQTVGDNSTKVATTAFVLANAGASGVSSINGTGGAYTFAGAGVSCASTTCTFSGTGSSGLTNITSLVTPTNCTVSSGACTTTGTVQAITFASIPSGYTHLHIVFQAITTSSSAALACTFNSDTAAHYAWQGNQVNSTSSAVFQGVSQSALTACGIAGSLTGGGTIDIPFYTSSNAKVVNVNVGEATSISSNAGNTDWKETGFWSGTAAITSIKFDAGSSIIASGSSFVIYGGN